MTRAIFIERIMRRIYGEQPSDDATITDNLVNQYINEGIGIAAKLNYKEAITLDGIGYVNNSFYSTFKGLTFAQDEEFTYVTTLPQIPMGIGKNEGIVSLKFKNALGNLSLDGIPLSENQWTYYQSLPKIGNKILYKQEGTFLYAMSTLLLNVGMTANITMISGGDSGNLNSLLNVPDDYLSIVFDYCVKNLTQERLQPKDVANDGEDTV